MDSSFSDLLVPADGPDGGAVAAGLDNGDHSDPPGRKARPYMRKANKSNVKQQRNSITHTHRNEDSHKT